MRGIVQYRTISYNQKVKLTVNKKCTTKKRTLLMAAARTLGAVMVSSLTIDSCGKSPLRRREVLVTLSITSGNFVDTGRSIG
jgi:hypothetical protein